MPSNTNPKTGYSNSLVAVTAVLSVILFTSACVFAYVMKNEAVAGVVNMALAAALVIPFHAAFNFHMNLKRSK